jgi:hypothetical protein
LVAVSELYGPLAAEGNEPDTFRLLVGGYIWCMMALAASKLINLDKYLPEQILALGKEAATRFLTETAAPEMHLDLAEAAGVWMRDSKNLPEGNDTDTARILMAMFLRAQTGRIQ